MSGTSLDGVDGVLADFGSEKPVVLGYATLPFDDALRQELLALNRPGDNELHQAALAGNALVQIYAQVVAQLVSDAKLEAGQVVAVGAHGQTVRHRPGEFDSVGYTLQLNQPALLAELCGIDVVADFRSRDVAAGGQGAPLVPPFHQAFFGTPDGPSAVLNIGGISNITLLNPGSATPLSGFDCGPGNALMDGWCKLHTGAAYDEAGRWAAGGAVNLPLLAALQGEAFFLKAPPKSTGRDLFNLEWLQRHLEIFPEVSPRDVQTTLTELTAWACAKSLLDYLQKSSRLIVCGGGALNNYLMQKLQHLLPDTLVSSSSNFGLPALQVEATAFAWLAYKAIQREPASSRVVTGARHERILGAIYPA
jgi:anhydro-N-acetylmuramic acid kinase